MCRRAQVCPAACYHKGGCGRCRGFHALRHTFATRALENGMDVRTLADILGHKNAAVTLNRYVHSLMPHKHEMMDRLGELL